MVIVVREEELVREGGFKEIEAMCCLLPYHHHPCGGGSSGTGSSIKVTYLLVEVVDGLG